jgi:DNA-binding MarR family transcriptional regulator
MDQSRPWHSASSFPQPRLCAPPGGAGCSGMARSGNRPVDPPSCSPAGKGPAQIDFALQQNTVLLFTAIDVSSMLMNDMIGSLLADVSRLMRRSFDARARAIGVTRAQWQVLSVLARHEGVNQGGLAELLDVEGITLCRMIDRLEEAGLVERRPNPADRRAWCLFLKDRARELLEELKPLAMDLIDESMTGLSDDDLTHLHQSLERIRTNLTKGPAPLVAANG